MSWLRPSDPSALARMVADTLVINSDSDAKGANMFYWHRIEPIAAIAAKRAVSSDDAATAAAAHALLTEPASPALHRRFCQLLAERLAADPEGEADLVDAAWRVTHRGRIGYHLGAYVGNSPVSHEVEAIRPVRRPSVPGTAAQIVIPFRDNTKSRSRWRNLQACLIALRHQEPTPGGYTVTVVETDVRPRFRTDIEAYADEYVFAPYAGPFNRAWAANVGVVQSGTADTVCILDADILADAEFIARNVARLREPGLGALIPYRDVLYLDAQASAIAIEARCHDGKSALDPEQMRGFLVHRPVGGCTWMLREVFDEVRGMDERYEGWGGEDIEFIMRLQLATALRSFDDTLLHLFHPSAVRLNEDGYTSNVSIPWFSWNPAGPIGELNRYSEAGAGK